MRTAAAPSHAATGSFVGVALRGSAWGLAVALVGLALAWFAVPESALPSASRVWMVRGLLVGAASGALGNVMIAHGALRVPADPRDTSALLRAIVLDFPLQFGAIAVSLVLMFSFSVKFAEMAAFGGSLAVAATLLRVGGTFTVNQALVRRARSRTQAVGQRPSQDSDS